EEADERHAELFGELHGERARGADGGEERAAGHHRLLHQLEARAAADDDAEARERQRVRHQAVADQLVERVVAADVLADEGDLAGGVEETRRVQAAGSVENVLLRAECVRQTAERVACDREVGAVEIEAALHLHGLEGRLAADAAARRGVEVTLEAIEIDVDAGRELDADDVDQAVRGGRAARAYGRDVVRAADDAFGVEEAYGELEVLAGRAHRDGNAPLAVLAVHEIAEPDLEWLLGRDHVVRDGARRADADPADLEMPNALPAQRFLYAGQPTPRPAPPRGARRPSPRRTLARSRPTSRCCRADSARRSAGAFPGSRSASDGRACPLWHSP